MPKSTENTVFVRFVPTPAHKVLRHELEDIFSQIGPIKKSNWINSKESDGSKGYGFVKYVSRDDAEGAASELNNTKIQMEGQTYTLKVELASLEQPKKEQSDDGKNKLSSSDTSLEDSLLKKKSRIILRNLSFYATEKQIRKVMEQNFGKVVDIHVPRVQSNLHVGFCFVTFVDPKAAKQAVQAKHIEIAKRTVNIDWSLPKRLHQLQQRQQQQTEEAHEQGALQEAKRDHEDKILTVSGDDEGGAGGFNCADQSSVQKSAGDDDSSSDEGGFEDTVEQKRTLFLRNLPFDVTRHAIFTLFAKFGHIDSIYIVKDRDTGISKGTAFVTYSQAEGAERAIQRASIAHQSPETTSLVSQGNLPNGNLEDKKLVSVLLLNDRRILVDFAVDKETAATFDTKEHHGPVADRRNMYLQAEARVESTSSDAHDNNSNTWDDIPEQDRKKRQTALKDKTTKLQSPIFFINPNRLSFRNMAKQIDEAGLQALVVLATKRGLDKGLVGAKDQIAHWRAKGTISTRDLLAKVKDMEGKGESIIPKWEGKAKIKNYVPSVYIDREFAANERKATAQSRGFGFAEFTHHAHALACLRELNNNPLYSKEYAAGGKIADSLKKKGRKGNAGGDLVSADGRILVPRLIVDFVVENKVKAKKQANRRLHQQLNQAKQKAQMKANAGGIEETVVEDGNGKRRSRGSIQREKKRRKKENGEDKAELQAQLRNKAMTEARKEQRMHRKEALESTRGSKGVKPPKKKSKVGGDDALMEDFERRKLASMKNEAKVVTPGARAVVQEKRWFE